MISTTPAKNVRGEQEIKVEVNKKEEILDFFTEGLQQFNDDVALLAPAGGISKDPERHFDSLVFTDLRDVQEETSKDFKDRIKLC